MVFEGLVFMAYSHCSGTGTGTGLMVLIQNYNGPSTNGLRQRREPGPIASQSSFSYLGLSANSLNSGKRKFISNYHSFTKEFDFFLSEQRVLCNLPVEKLFLSKHQIPDV